MRSAAADLYSCPSCSAFKYGEQDVAAPRFIDKRGLKTKGIPWNNSTIWRKEKSGQFPKHVMIGNRCAWVEDEVDAYLEGLVAARDSAAA
jgi:predicted DNA-binding transcriptional regulator AlpA